MKCRLKMPAVLIIVHENPRRDPLSHLLSLKEQGELLGYPASKVEVHNEILHSVKYGFTSVIVK
jgi:hypothetical protein